MGVSGSITPARPAAGRRRDWPSTLIGIALVIAAGVVLGMQYIAPDKRMIAVLAAMVMFGIAWRINMLWGIGLLVLAIPYPRGTVFGNTNVALILLLLVIWLLRVTQRQAAPAQRSPVDVPMVGLFIAYVVSFYNVRAGSLYFAFQAIQMLAASMLMFFLIVNNVRTERDLMRFHLFLVASLVSICLLGIFELNNPAGTFIPGWIKFGPGTGEVFETRGMRVGGPFFDYELMAEYCAVSLLLVGFLVLRATSMSRRLVMLGILLLDTFVLFTTVTRGAVFSLGFALLYLLWIVRRRVRVVPFTLTVASMVVGFLVMNYAVANFTRSGDLIARLTQTQFYGLVPDSRRTAWEDGWERFLIHPMIGHGPHYSAQTGTRTWLWPHNGYLYLANLVGLVGLAFYLWLVGRLFLVSRPVVDRLDHPSYAKSYLIIAHVQLVLFLIDQIKIDFLRSYIYQFQAWILFASLVAAHQVVKRLDSAVPEAAR